jgi:hypothetical protein
VQPPRHQVSDAGNKNHEERQERNEGRRKVDVEDALNRLHHGHAGFGREDEKAVVPGVDEDHQAEAAQEQGYTIN